MHFIRFLEIKGIISLKQGETSIFSILKEYRGFLFLYPFMGVILGMAHRIEAILELKDNMSATLKIAEGNLERFGKNLNAKGNQLRNLGSTFEYLGKDIMKLNAPFLALGGWATKLGIDFEAVTSEAQAIMDVAPQQMDAFKDKAREIGAVTSKSATEAMEGMKLLAQAGLEQNEIMELSYPLVRLSEAGNLKLARSAELLTNSMKSAEVPLSNVEEYLDQVAKVSNEANTNIEAQMEAWNSAGGSIASANMSMAETNALLGILANRGVLGAEAGNAISRVFQNLNATSGEAGKAMQQLGIEVANADGTMRNKIDVLKELKEKTDNMTESERERYLTMIGGKAHTENLKKILAGLGDEYDELRFKLENANGALEKMAIVMKDNLKGKLETLSSATEEFGLKLAEVLLPKIEKAVDKVQDFVDKLNGMDKEQLDATVNIVLLTTKLALMFIAFGKITSIIGNFTKNIGGLARLFGENSLLAKSFGVSGLKLARILGIIGIVIAAVVKHWDRVGPAISRAFNAIKEFFMGSGIIMEAVENIKEAFNGILEGIAIFIEGFLDIITGIFSGDLSMIIDGVVNIFKGGWEVIKNLWLGLLEILSIRIEARVSLIEGAFPGVANLIRTIWGGLKSFLSNPAQAVARLRDRASAAMERVKNKWTEVKNTLRSKAQGTVTAITDAFHSAVNRVKKTWEGLKNFMSNPIKGTVNLAQRGANWVKSKVGNNWQGTSSWRGGLTHLHEKGGEIYDLPRGTRVYPHDKSIEMARQEGFLQASTNNNSVVVDKIADTIVIREEADIDKIADRLASKIKDTKFNMA